MSLWLRKNGCRMAYKFKQITAKQGFDGVRRICIRKGPGIHWKQGIFQLEECTGTLLLEKEIAMRHWQFSTVPTFSDSTQGSMFRKTPGGQLALKFSDLVTNKCISISEKHGKLVTSETNLVTLVTQTVMHIVKLCYSYVTHKNIRKPWSCETL